MIEKNPVPVVPVIINGLWGSVFSKKSPKDRIHRRGLTIEFLKPISPTEFQLGSLEALFKAKLEKG